MKNLLKSHVLAIFLIFSAAYESPAQALLYQESKDTVVTSVVEKAKVADLPEGNNKRFLHRGVLPSTFLIAAGIYTMKDRGFFSSYDLFDYRTKTFPNFSTNADDFAMLAPLVGLYSINLISEASRHNIPRQTLLLISSGLITSALVWPTKVWTGVERPNGERHAFPSGHTAYAFTIATFMDKEFRHKYPWVSVASYTIAGGTGILRVLNNKHWLSDILAGAGVGILSVNTVYWLHGKISRGKGKRTSFTPFILPTGQSGMTVTIKL